MKTRTNGSRRRRHSTNTNMKKWLTNGITVASINIRGLTFLKLYVILAQQDIDILCVQETWLAQNAMPPNIPGYNIVEERRRKGNRGGIATYVKK
jgi:exonuclease III